MASLQIAYVWHASVFTREVLNGLERIGFVYPQQIFWDKGRTVLTRTHYWYQHEPCWYVRKPKAAWFGKASENSTIWAAASPKFIMGGSDKDKFDHPTQKPVELICRPILNHLKRGELVYKPFLGSGTTLAAVELTERVCCGIELDPKFMDVIVQRWQTLSGKRPNSRAMDECSKRSPRHGGRSPHNDLAYVNASWKCSSHSRLEALEKGREQPPADSLVLLNVRLLTSARCGREIADVEAALRAGHPDVQGLCVALADWSRELRLLQRELGLASK